MLELLKQVRQKAVIGFVGGSDLAKITEQLAVHGQNSRSSLPLRSVSCATQVLTPDTSSLPPSPTGSHGRL